MNVCELVSRIRRSSNTIVNSLIGRKTSVAVGGLLATIQMQKGDTVSCGISSAFTKISDMDENVGVSSRVRDTCRAGYLESILSALSPRGVRFIRCSD